jgi:putative tryptophan/tyrosine transport system substrate-binding protein
VIEVALANYSDGCSGVRRRTFVAVSGATLLVAAGLAPAQGPAALRRIGYLSGFNRVAGDFLLRALRPELEKLGWTEGRNFVFLEPRMAEGANERLPILAAELVAESPDVILVQTVPATRDLGKATKSIPVVMVAVAAPVELGIVADYRRPGGNVTGSSYLAAELMRKALQLLKEAAPRLRSVAVFVNPSNELSLDKQMRADAMALGMHAQILGVTGKGDFEAAFAAIRAANTESILLPPEPLIQANRESIDAFAKARGLPLAVVGTRGALPASGLFVYGTNLEEYARVTAKYVDRILRGAKPGDLPIEQPTRFSLVINLRAARSLGLTIPQSMLLLADEVIQ